MIEIVYEDDFLLVAAKPQGMSVHPAPGVRSETLVEWLRRYYEEQGVSKPHVAAVSRLDRGTSGLILVVTDPSAHPALHKQIVARAVRREYQCLVWGRPLFRETRVDIPVGRHWQDWRRMAAYDLSWREAAAWGARPAATNLRVLQAYGDAALLGATLETGRMHQIRVHCQFIRRPIVGDPTYGLRRNRRGFVAPSSAQDGRSDAWNEPSEDRRRIVEDSLEFQCLHAGRLQFRHPITGESMEFEQPVPENFLAAERALASGVVY